MSPVTISFNQAILVAVAGLIVNGVCLVILGGHGDDHRRHEHTHPLHRHDHEDHNLRSAYLHVLADAVTSILAICALLAGKYFRQVWLDPFIGVIGAVLVARWSLGLLYMSGRVLLDMQAPQEMRDEIKRAVESNGDNRITDLHLWSVGPGIYAAEIAVVSSQPMEAEGYCALLPRKLGLVHVTVETRLCTSPTTFEASHSGLLERKT